MFRSSITDASSRSFANKESQNIFRKMKYYSFWFAVLTVSVVIISVSIVFSEEETSQKRTKVILDVDTGVDDAIAILYLLRAEKYLREQSRNDFEILGITCVRGNTDVDNVVVNVLKTLKVANRLDIPVFRGASCGILESPSFNFYFGNDGFGDVPDPDPPLPSMAQSEHAVTALIRMVNENPGEVTILALGPLTNIALAIKMDENFLKKVKNIVIFGGSVEGRGNVLPGVEYNFYADAEAVKIVTNSTAVDQGVIVLFPWEAVLKTTIPLKWRKEEMGNLISPEITFMNKLEHVQNHTDGEMWLMGDPMVAITLLHKDLIVRNGYYGVNTVTNGPSKGMIAVDYDNFLDSANKIEIIFEIDSENLKSYFLKYFT